MLFIISSGGKQLSRFFIFLSFSLFLSSCIEVSEEFWVNDDGSGRMKIDMGLSPRMAAMAQLGGNRGENSPGNPFENAEANLADNSNVESFDLKEETRGDMLFYIMDVTVKDLSTIAEALNKSMSQGEGPSQEIRLTKLDNGNLKFVQPLNFNTSNQSKEANNPFAAGLMAAMLQGRHMTIRIHGNIVNANGTIAEDGRSVEWKIPLVDAFSGRITMKQAEAEISLGSRLQIDPELLTIILGAIGVVVIATVAFLLGKKSRT